ncbi:MAG: serine/threonine-protein phosphatase [Hahellaceae bacterium]|nr:serine/threonine-protein phosphatase [Hahellaceae bacterium]
MYISFATTHKGHVREKNEDALLANPDLGLWVVADGVGGNVHGEFASQLAVKTVEKKVRQGIPLVDAIDAAHWSVVEAARKNPDLRGMATTIVACLFHGNRFRVAWVGDSRAYLLSNRVMRQLTTDHNEAGELQRTDDLTEAQADAHPGQHYLTRALGLERAIEIELVDGELEKDDRLLLCSDGLSGEISRNQLYAAMSSSISDQQKLDMLLEAALVAGGSDNVTLAIIGLDRNVLRKEKPLIHEAEEVKAVTSDTALIWKAGLVALSIGVGLALVVVGLIALLFKN